MKFNKLPQYNKSDEMPAEYTKDIQWEPKTVEMEEGFAEKMAGSLGRKQQIDEGIKKIGEYTSADGSTYTRVHKLSGEHNEGDPYRVRLYKNNKHYEPADYFTNDEQDAHSTAKHMIKEGYDDTMDPEMIGFKQTAAEKQLGAKRKQQQDRAEKTAAVTRTVKRGSTADHSDSDVSEPEATKKEFKVGSGLKHAAPSWLSPKPVAAKGEKKEFGVTTKQETKPVTDTRKQALQSRLDRLPKKHPDRVKLEKQIARLKEDVELEEGWKKENPNSQERRNRDREGKKVQTPGGVGVIKAEYKVPTFSQSVPFTHEVHVVHDDGSRKVYPGRSVKLIKESELDEMAKDTVMGADRQMKLGIEDQPKKSFSIKDKVTGQIKRSFKTMKDAVAHHISMPAHLKAQHQVVFAESYEINPIDWYSAEIIHEGESFTMSISDIEEAARGGMTDLQRKQRGFINASSFFKMSKDKQREHMINVGGMDPEKAAALTAEKGKK